MATTYKADVEAQAMMDALSADATYTIPNIDLSGDEYQIPYDSSMSVIQKPLTNESLTTRTVGGQGTFDALMAGVSAHIKEEYTKGRITGAEYTKAYIASVEASIQGAVQYLIQRDSAYWQSMQAQAQATTARVALVSAKVQLAGLQFEALNNKASYALTKAKLAEESVAFGQGQFNIDKMMPQQLALVGGQISMTKEQMESARAQTLDTRSDNAAVGGVLGMQKKLYTQQIESYKRDAEVKTAKLFTDAWITQKTVDEGTLPPNNFSNASLDTILAVLKTNNGFI